MRPHTSGVREDLPVLVKGAARKEEGHHNDNPGGNEEAESDIDTNTEPAA